MPLLIREALLQAQALGVQRLDAQLLLLHVLEHASPEPSALPTAPAFTRSWLLAHDDQALTPAQAPHWAQVLQRRAGGEPLAYVVGEQAFCGLRLQVTPAVLIPRPETEGLVLWALECLLTGSTEPKPRVLDLGTGSGAVALAIKHRCARAQVHATDISAAALAVAQANAQQLQLEVRFGLSDWWAAAPQAKTGAAAQQPAASAVEGPFHLVVSNPPYVAPGDHHLAALQHEPSTALIGADDGLGDLRRIVTGSPRHLVPGAWLLLEHGHDQAERLHHLLVQAGFEQVQTRNDLAGFPRCTGARRPF